MKQRLSGDKEGDEIESFWGKITTLQETVEVLIENYSVKDSDVTPVIKVGVEQNHPAADRGWKLMSYIKMMILRE